MDSKQIKTDKENIEVSDDKDYIIKLNVGGKHFQTTLKCLANYKDGLLYKLAHNFVSNTTNIGVLTDNLGNLFIDRNPECFSYVLDYHRMMGHINSILPESHDKLKRIRDDIRYYCLFEFDTVTIVKGIFEKVVIKNVIMCNIICHFEDNTIYSPYRTMSGYYANIVIQYYINGKYLFRFSLMHGDNCGNNMCKNNYMIKNDTFYPCNNAKLSVFVKNKWIDLYEDFTDTKIVDSLKMTLTYHINENLYSPELSEKKSISIDKNNTITHTCICVNGNNSHTTKILSNRDITNTFLNFIKLSEIQIESLLNVKFDLISRQ